MNKAKEILKMVENISLNETAEVVNEKKFKLVVAMFFDHTKSKNNNLSKIVTDVSAALKGERVMFDSTSSTKTVSELVIVSDTEVLDIKVLRNKLKEVIKKYKPTNFDIYEI